MATEALIEVGGTVLELLPEAWFCVRLDDEHAILACAMRAVRVR